MFYKLTFLYLTFLFIINNFISFSNYWLNYDIIDNFSYTLSLYDHHLYNKLIFDIHSISHLNWGIIISVIFNYNFTYSNIFHIIWELFENCPISASYYNMGIIEYPDYFINSFFDQIFFIIGFFISKKINNKKISILLYLLIDISWLIMNIIITPLGCFINLWTVLNVFCILTIIFYGYFENKKFIKL